jgi:hypothetical protein
MIANCDRLAQVISRSNTGFALYVYSHMEICLPCFFFFFLFSTFKKALKIREKNEDKFLDVCFIVNSQKSLVFE